MSFSPKVAIHQPNFLPWMGYFHKMSRCEVFVYFDDVSFSKGSYTNRVSIHSSKNHNENQWLTIPVKKHSLNTLINHIEIDRSQNFEDKIIGQLKASYGNSENYNLVEEMMQDLFESAKDLDGLADYNIHILDYFRNLLDIKVEVIRSSELDYSLNSQNKVLEICQLLGAKEYISGMGAKNYQDDGAFAQKEIAVSYVNYPASVSSFTEVQENKLTNKSIISYLAEGLAVKRLMVWNRIDI